MNFFFFFFFFKQKTAYEMSIGDWSSDVCSSDLWTGTRYRPQSDQADARDLSWDTKNEGYRWNGSSQGFRQARRHGERYGSPWRQPHFSGERTEVRDAVEVFPSQFRNEPGSLRSLRSALGDLRPNERNTNRLPRRPTKIFTEL